MKELIVSRYPKSSVAEAIKTVRTNLRFSSVNKKIKTILVTSSIAGEGKSFISANLATTFATSKEKVLLIDCDLRRGRQQELFGNGYFSSLELSNLLIDDNWKRNLKKYIQSTEVSNLDIITVGSVPPNPTVLLESKKMEIVIEELRNKYDVIIFDAPPVGGLTDALILSRLADTVLIVAMAKKTTLELLENTKKALENVNAVIAGVILNRVEMKTSKYYKNYYSNSYRDAEYYPVYECFSSTMALIGPEHEQLVSQWKDQIERIQLTDERSFYDSGLDVYTSGLFTLVTDKDEVRELEDLIMPQKYYNFNSYNLHGKEFLGGEVFYLAEDYAEDPQSYADVTYDTDSVLADVTKVPKKYLDRMRYDEMTEKIEAAEK